MRLPSGSHHIWQQWIVIVKNGDEDMVIASEIGFIMKHSINDGLHSPTLLTAASGI